MFDPLLTRLREVGGFILALLAPTMPRHKWNIVESGVKRHDYNPIIFTLFIILLWDKLGYEL